MKEGTWGADPLVRGRSPDRPGSVPAQRDQGIARGPGGPPPMALLLFLPSMLHAQLALFSFDGTTDTPVGQTYNFGTVGAGQIMDVRFHVKNTGSTPVTSLVICTPQGTGFTLAARHALARVTGLQRRYAEAEQTCREVLAGRCRALGDDHPDTLTSRATLAWLAARLYRRGYNRLFSGSTVRRRYGGGATLDRLLEFSLGWLRPSTPSRSWPLSLATTPGSLARP